MDTTELQEPTSAQMARSRPLAPADVERIKRGRELGKVARTTGDINDLLCDSKSWPVTVPPSTFRKWAEVDYQQVKAGFVEAGWRWVEAQQEPYVVELWPGLIEERKEEQDVV